MMPETTNRFGRKPEQHFQYAIRYNFSNGIYSVSILLERFEYIDSTSRDLSGFVRWLDQGESRVHGVSGKRISAIMKRVWGKRSALRRIMK